MSSGEVSVLTKITISPASFLLTASLAVKAIFPTAAPGDAGRALPRTGNQRLIEADLMADDNKFFLKIPQKELDANDNIDDSVNADR